MAVSKTDRKVHIGCRPDLSCPNSYRRTLEILLTIIDRSSFSIHLQILQILFFYRIKKVSSVIVYFILTQQEIAGTRLQNTVNGCLFYITKTSIYLKSKISSVIE